jgi:DNA-binding phage protein
MTRSTEMIRKFWMDGHSVAAIAKQLKMSRTTIYKHLMDRQGKLPPRPWATAGTLGIHPVTMQRLHDAHLVRRIGSLYSVEDTERHFRERSTLKCKHVNCENLVPGTNRNTKFCEEHQRDGVDPDHVVALVAKRPGITRALLYQALRATAGTTLPALEQMIADGQLVAVAGDRRTAYYLPSDAPITDDQCTPQPS